MILRRRRFDRDGAPAGMAPERAIIDIGSNTVRLVVYGGTLRAPVVRLNEKVTARLGQGLAASGMLAEADMALARRGLARFVLLLEDLGIADVQTVATAAVRDAANGAAFAASLSALGLAVRVISGAEEARLSAQGVIGAFPEARGIVSDLGGGSLELIRVAEGRAGEGTSLPLGTLRLPEQRKGGAMRKSLEKTLRKAGWDLAATPPADNGALYLVGGTWRATAAYAMIARGHPLSDPHGFELAPVAAAQIADELAQRPPEALRMLERISAMRADKLPDAAVLLQALLARLNPERVVFSSWGLREGLLFDRLPEHARAQDPLLAGVAAFAGQRGAPATVAAQMAAWTLDAAPARDHGSERLRLAAIMLALASLQIEPNIRQSAAINWALHKRWIGIDGKGRAMLAAAIAAIAAIAANGNQLALTPAMRALASEEALEEAVRWGLALRVARRLGAGSRRSLEVSRLSITAGALVLRLASSHAALFGPAVEKDMKLLAGRLGLEWRVALMPERDLRAG